MDGWGPVFLRPPDRVVRAVLNLPATWGHPTPSAVWIPPVDVTGLLASLDGDLAAQVRYEEVSGVYGLALLAAAQRAGLGAFWPGVPSTYAELVTACSLLRQDPAGRAFPFWKAYSPTA